MNDKIKILLLEDNPADAELAQYEVKQAGLLALFKRVETKDDFVNEIEKGDYDIILSDYTLPCFDGRSALALAKRICPETAFIFVTGTLGEELAIYLLKSGATDYILKSHLGKLGSAVMRALREREERQDCRKAEQELKESVLRLKKMAEGTIQAMATTTELRDPYTAGHQRRVAMLSSAIGVHMGLKSDMVAAIIFSGTIHDVGKIVVPTAILNKMDKLSPDEYEILKTHPRAGYDIIKHIEFPWPIADIVLQHHERINGSGYPAGLSGETIHMASKIIAVADVVESMAFARPYRPALGLEKAFDEIEKNKNILYDAAAVEACIHLFRVKGFLFS
jgi:putative two-component system response regulator